MTDDIQLTHVSAMLAPELPLYPLTQLLNHHHSTLQARSLVPEFPGDTCNKTPKKSRAAPILWGTQLPPVKTIKGD